MPKSTTICKTYIYPQIKTRKRSSMRVHAIALMLLPLSSAFISSSIPQAGFQQHSRRIATTPAALFAALPTPEESAEALRDYMVKSGEVRTKYEADIKVGGEGGRYNCRKETVPEGTKRHAQCQGRATTYHGLTATVTDPTDEIQQRIALARTPHPSHTQSSTPPRSSLTPKSPPPHHPGDSRP